MRPPEFVDFYEILGLAPGASLDDVREAWRRCARIYHPDLNPRKTSFRFRRAKEAYDTLVDPARRRDYDRLYRLRKGVFGRSTAGKRPTSPFIGTPPGGRTAPPPGGSRPARPGPARPSPSPGSHPPGSARAPQGGTGAVGNQPAGSAGSSASPRTSPAPAPGAAQAASPQAKPDSSDVRTRTSFRPATMFQEVRGTSLIDQLKEAVTQGGASRVTLRHNGKTIWESHITSSLMDDITQRLIGPITALLRLLGQEEQFQLEITNELVEDYNHGNALYDEGKLEEAKASYKRCVERDKYFAPAHLSLGAVYEAQKEIPIAIQCYQNTVKIDPGGEAGRFARENLRRLRGY